MKKLNFIFKNSTEVIYDCEVPYTLSDGFVCFKYDNSDYMFKLDDNLEFRRRTSESEFKLICRDGLPTCNYFINELNSTVDVGVIDFEYKIVDGEYYIKYTLESDEENEKSIILRINRITY